MVTENIGLIETLHLPLDNQMTGKSFLEVV